MKKFALLGEHLKHSYSPMIHKQFGDYRYDILEISREELESTIRNPEYSGFNVTIPYKKEAMRYCDEISHEAEEIGSINTIIKDENGLIKGFNTDYHGFMYLLTKNHIDPGHKKCLILGNGGACLTVKAVLRALGAREIVVISRSGEDNYDNIDRHSDCQIIVNTTPVGMYPDNLSQPVNLDMFPALDGVVDLIYNPYRTKLILDAMERDINCAGGLEMLVAQGRESSEMFTGFSIDEETVPSVVEEIKSATLNKILIGMPGAGKTTRGRELARSMGREFIDTDEEIIKREGMSIPEIFEKKGEIYFRKLETEVLMDACKENGRVIAAGGGVVKKQVNYNIIKQNGMVIWVKRDLDKLETEGRPLSQTNALEDLYKERAPLYQKWSDYFINNNEDRE